jgi:tetratricopeptide (TPR) repeat protein
MKKYFLLYFALSILCSCGQGKTASDIKINTSQGISLLNRPLIKRQVNPQLDSLQIENYLEALDDYEVNKENVNHIVWLGRRTAYLGDFKRAIEIYSEGINKFPEEARLYRHRGHRYISTRQLDKAIADLEKAVLLIKDKEDVIEQDGIPNSLNQPISTLHTNIWYHLGLAYYLKNNLQKSLVAFKECLLKSNNDDLQVATRHWMYMILKRMELSEQANVILDPIHKDMTIIENFAYHNLLLFYKGELSEKELKENNNLASSLAVQYGIGNWYYYNDNKEKAIQIFEEITKTSNWAVFGYLAAEADLSRIKE